MRCLTLKRISAVAKEALPRVEWKRQTTCVTPLKRLPWYTAILVGQTPHFGQHLSAGIDEPQLAVEDHHASRQT
jgi:hypothetical protein